MKKTIQLSVELEPPALYHPEWPLQALENQFLRKIEKLAEYCDWISITNRHIYNMSSLTAVKKALRVLNAGNISNNIKMAMHLTTRTNAIDTYKQLLDAQNVGLKYLMPLLGDPRGPKAPGYFDNALDLLRYSSYIATGNEHFINQISSKRLGELLGEDKSLPRRNNFKNNFFSIGTVLDPNPVRIINGSEISIRKNEIRLFQKKIDAGATYFMTQAIFSADDYFSFLDDVDNPKIPIGIGLIPARLGLTERIGVKMPKTIIQKLKRSFSDKKEHIKEGNKIVNEIWDDLLYRGKRRVDWIHVYSFGSLANVFEIIGKDLDELAKNNRKSIDEKNSIFLRSL